MLKKSLWVLIVFIPILVLAWFGQENIQEWIYDASHNNPKVTRFSQIDSVFQNLEIIAYSDIPKAVLNTTHSSKPQYAKHLKTKTYYKLSRQDFQKKVVGNYRLKHFLTTDALYATTITRNKPNYTCLDKRVLHKFLELLQTLERQGLNTKAIKLRSGHRHPKRNYYIGGASQSRHIYGEAIDIGVGDLNNDGKTTDADKQIVLDLLDKEIIGNKGGIGLYPGTKAVHFDVRGHRARWNSYTPAIRKKN
jgi:uncharacterized protein YcbK (DUF882 family)